jgi:hypothetical protein
LKQIVGRGFVTVRKGRRTINVFSRADGWRDLAADEAARRVALARLPKEQANKPVVLGTVPNSTAMQKPVTQKPVKSPKPVERTMRQVPSLPRMSWDEGR